MRRIILITTTIALLIFLGVGVWFYLSPSREIRDLLPPVFSIPGEGDFEPTDPGDPGVDEEDERDEGELPALRKISEAPVSGFGITEREVVVGVEPAESPEEEDTPIVGTTTAIRYIEKETGHIYEYVPDNDTTRRITNTTIPRTHEAIIDAQGTNIVLRYLNNQQQIETFVGSVESATGTQEGTVSGSFLERNITELATNLSKDRLFYLVETSSGVAGRISNFDGSDEETIFQSPFTQWLINWNTPQSLLLTTKPSGNTFGYSYQLNTQTGDLTRTIGNREGLTVSEGPTGDRILFGTSPRSIMALSLLSQEQGQVISLPVPTLPEKCVWTHDGTRIVCGVPENPSQGTYPDIWYQGIISFSDDIWVINTETGNANVFIDNTPEEVDIVSPYLSPSEDVFVFRNKKDNSLWLLELQEGDLF